MHPDLVITLVLGAQVLLTGLGAATLVVRSILADDADGLPDDRR